MTTVARRRHRVLRKASRQAQDELDRRFNAKMGEQRTELNAALAEVNGRYVEAMTSARNARDAERAEVWKKYNAARDELLKRLAKEAEKAEQA